MIVSDSRSFVGLLTLVSITLPDDTITTKHNNLVTGLLTGGGSLRPCKEKKTLSYNYLRSQQEK